MKKQTIKDPCCDKCKWLKANNDCKNRRLLANKSGFETHWCASFKPKAGVQ